MIMINKIGCSPINNTSFKATLNIKGDFDISPNGEEKLKAKAAKIGTQKDSIDIDVFQPGCFVDVPSGSVSQGGGRELARRFIPTTLFWDAIINGKKLGGVVSNDENDILATDYDAVNDTLDILATKLASSKE